MAIGDIFTARVESFAQGGRGVLHPEGRAVFMELTAPGDTVTGRISAEHKTWAEAELLEVLESSPLRTEPVCPSYGICGGCSLQHIRYDAQLELKKTAFAETLARIGGIPPESLTDPSFFSAEASPPWEYRNRFSFHTPKRAAGFGYCFMGRKSSRLVPVGDCPIADPLIRSWLKSVKTWDDRGQGPGYKRGHGHEYGHEPDAGTKTGRCTVYAREKDGIFLSELGTRRGQINLAGTTITVDAGLFFQSNAAMLERLLAVLRSEAAAAASPLPMADLYAGTGTFSLFLSETSGGADLLEHNTAALELARINLAGADADASAGTNGKGRFRFYAEKDERWARRQLSGYGFVVADPPRRGLSPALAAQLATSGPPVLAYVSCDPGSLARDCRILTPAYSLERLRLFDFYPQTAHVESLALFKRRV